MVIVLACRVETGRRVVDRFQRSGNACTRAIPGVWKTVSPILSRMSMSVGLAAVVTWPRPSGPPVPCGLRKVTVYAR